MNISPSLFNLNQISAWTQKTWATSRAAFQGFQKTALKVAVGVLPLILSMKDPLVALAAQNGILGASLAYQGSKNLLQGKYKEGAVKILGGVGCMGASLYCLYASSPSSFERFQDRHQADLDTYSPQELMGHKDWEFWRTGGNKHIFRHPELPGYVIKFQSFSKSYWARESGIETGNSIEGEFRNLIEAQEILNTHQIERIVLPETHLMQSQRGPFLIQQELPRIMKIDIRLGIFTTDPQAPSDLQKFLKHSPFCDLDLDYKYENTGYLMPARDLHATHIGIVDLDCRKITK